MRYIELKDGSIYKFENMKIMGILNATDNSFYPKSRVGNVENAVNRAMKMIEDGADILDIGGESTRPGSDPITVDEEIDRVVPIIKGIREKGKDILISVDTYRSKTAEEAIKAGADIINDISAMTFDENMANVVKKYNVPVILMHIKGTPKNMQKNPHYDDVVKEVQDYFKERIQYAKDKGIKEEKIILDPGIGFGKNFQHNMELIRNIDRFFIFNLPILLAVSRKTSIGEALGGLPVDERLEGTMAISCYAAMKDVDIVRVHDVLENKRAVDMIEVLK
ncbi:dihydropteroate synthase [Keratinibaculum paraultunense]|uniref:Dihydropteroate synthase n=1 Tax=Keratinibaculum paraultunense TaxID=1278232 RepID=A0A4R3KYG5_9FIRM|nr:dihydropteroate synthase [Keratinibaculum paraultunense]QQY78861.1 dihydropteroate synthase [Keratinibaculum paraultunense]TCS90471.1 dihydropteroate synthase [Keratinibaculum paraultunense]